MRLKFLCVMMIVFSILPMNMVFSEEIPVYDEDEICNVQFLVGYLGDSFKGNIAVVFQDIASDKRYQFVLEREKGFNANKSYGILADTTYEAFLTYDKEKFEITNSDGTKITKYHATTSGLYIHWMLKDKVVEESKESENKDTLDRSTKINSNMEDDEVLNEFVKETKFIADDPNYEMFLVGVAPETARLEFLKVEGNTEEKWETMSKYNRACYTLLVLDPRRRVLGVNHSFLSKDKQAFFKGLRSLKNWLNNIQDGDIVYQAIEDVWVWHWDNWKNERKFINLFENTTYGENDQKEHEISKEDAKIEKEIIKEIEKDTPDLALGKEKADEQNEFAKNGKLLELLKKNIITFVILIVVGGALLFIYMRNRRENYDDN